MPRFLSSVTARASSMASIGATQTLSTPCAGANHESQRPSGAICACARVGFPNNLARGMRGGWAAEAVSMDAGSDALLGRKSGYLGAELPGSKGRWRTSGDLRALGVKPRRLRGGRRRLPQDPRVLAA